MRRLDRHEYRQAYNAQAVVCADGSQRVVATNLVATTADAPSFADTILAMEQTIGLPKVVLADIGYASAPAVTALEAKAIEPLVAIGGPSRIGRTISGRRRKPSRRARSRNPGGSR